MARAISSFRIRRLLNLVTFLRKKGEYGAEVTDIMDYCEYNDRRALQEDIKMLRNEYRTEIIFKRKKPYRYYLQSEGDFLLSLNLNEEDVIALVAGLGMVSHFIPPMENNCIVVPKSRTKKGRKRDKVKGQRLRHDSYISRGVIFPGKDICGRSSL